MKVRKIPLRKPLTPLVRLTKGNPNRQGFTLLEMAIAVSAMIVILGGAFTVLFTGEKLFAQQMREFSYDQAGRRVMGRLGEELRAAYPSTLQPLLLFNSSSVSFQKVIGFAGGTAQLSPRMTFAFALAPGETVNGLDDNGDGLRDEGFLTLTQDGGQAVRLCGDVLALRFTSSPNGMSYAADLALVDDRGQVTQRTYSQQVAFRNP